MWLPLEGVGNERWIINGWTGDAKLVPAWNECWPINIRTLNSNLNNSSSVIRNRWCLCDCGDVSYMVLGLMI